MKKNLSFGLFVLSALVLLFSANGSLGQQVEVYPVLVDGKVAPGTGFGINVDGAGGKRDWLSSTVESLEIKYPGNLDWGAVFITVGGAGQDPPRPSKDFSKFKRLVIEMKGAEGGEHVHVGIKDFNDPDDGQEPKKEIEITDSWKEYTIDLAFFGERPRNRNALDLTKLYVVTEFVFPTGPQHNEAQTIFVRNIKFTE